MATFKIGDKVRRIMTDNAPYFSAGAVGIVSKNV